MPRIHILQSIVSREKNTNGEFRRGLATEQVQLRKPSNYRFAFHFGSGIRKEGEVLHEGSRDEKKGKNEGRREKLRNSGNNRGKGRDHRVGTNVERGTLRLLVWHTLSSFGPSKGCIHRNIWVSVAARGALSTRFRERAAPKKGMRKKAVPDTTGTTGAETDRLSAIDTALIYEFV